MRKFILFLLLVTTIATLKAQNTSCNQPIWSDEFDYPGAPSTDKWGYDIGGGGWGNQELQTYTNSRNNSWVNDGKLFIKAIKTNGSWSSARLVTRQKGDWLYGRIEVRAKIPAGRGVWAAIWMLPTDWSYGSWPKSGEIDIMEHVGYDANRIYGTIHTEAYNHTLGTQKGSNTMVPTAYTEFHDYVTEWDEENIYIYVDDKLYFTFTNPHKTTKEWPFNRRFHLIMNIAIGGSWGGSQGIDASLTEAVMEVEHVRVYKMKPTKPVIDGTGLLLPGQEVSFSTKRNNDYTYKWDVPEDATITSGLGTNKVYVTWGETAGQVKVSMLSECDTIASDPFYVNFVNDAETYKISNFGADSSNWKIIPTVNNTYSLEKEGDDYLKVNFDVQKPSNSPNIEYFFDQPHNFEDFSQMIVTIKTEQDKSPANFRIDMVDVSGKVESDKLFRITQPIASGNFETYSHIFGEGTTTKFDIKNVKSIKIYFNYGSSGRIGTGSFTIGSIEMKNKTTSSNSLKYNTLNLWPNPATDYIMLEKPYKSFAIYNSQGARVYEEKTKGTSPKKIDVSNLTPGIYLLQSNGEGNIYRSKFIKDY